MKKPKTVQIKVSLLRKAMRLIKAQQTAIHELQNCCMKKRRKRRARNTQPMDAGIGMSGIQMGN